MNYSQSVMRMIKWVAIRLRNRVWISAWINMRRGNAWCFSHWFYRKFLLTDKLRSYLKIGKMISFFHKKYVIYGLIIQICLSNSYSANFTFLDSCRFSIWDSMRKSMTPILVEHSFGFKSPRPAGSPSLVWVLVLLKTNFIRHTRLLPL